MNAQRESVASLREQSATVESSLRHATEKVGLSATEQETLEASISELRALAGKLVEESARMQAESQQAEETAARHAAAEEQRSEAARAMGIEWAALSLRVKNEEDSYAKAERRVQELGAAARDAQARLVALRAAQQESARQLKETREALSAERARHSSVEQILSERAYTADAVQKLFNEHHGAETRGFHAVGLLADYAEVQEQYEGAIEQFLREELEYVVVESFDQARAGVALLRDEMGGRATFFVDSLSKLNIRTEADASLPMPEGVIARLDRLVDFRDPLGPAAKHFLTRLRTAYLVETGAAAEMLAHENPHSYYLTLDGTCYHGRMVSGGRQGDAGPLALKRELRQHEAEAARLDRAAQEQQEELTRIEMAIAGGEAEVADANAKHVEAEKSFVGAMHTRDQARAEHRRVEQQLAAEQQEIAWLHQEAEAARNRVEHARKEHAEALRSRANAEADAARAAEKLAELRRDFQSLQEQVIAQREALATMTERFTSAEAAEQRLVQEMALASERTIALQEQHGTLLQEKADLEVACEQLSVQVEDLRKEKIRAEELKASLEKEWDEARTRAGQLDESLRGKRQSLDELRSERNQRQIEKARNDADRDYLRQTCVAELNAQPEELMAQAQGGQLLIGEELIAAETNYNEMKARIEAMGPVNMMALEEFKECEERESFLRRERDDLVQSIENTQLTITELDQVSRQKFEEAFNFINAQFAVAFQSLFGGGHGEMRLGEPDSSGEMGIDIVAQPPGKRLQNILLLSGGEKALTALALLIAVFRYQPSPFCILDEVDAPLDEANVGRFNKMLAEMCAQTQFIVVTHNRKTMEMGSVLYGVTMQEPGVSKLVSVKWEEAEQASTPKAASNAA
jgi:chromosome segregation protein